jgi:Cdc6-like AAA superfamily ATPase
VDKKKKLWSIISELLEMNLGAEAIQILQTLESVGNGSVRKDKPSQREIISLSELVNSASPDNNRDLILLTAYYLHGKENFDTFTTRDINRELTNISEKPSNTTRDLSDLLDQEPKLIIQLEKTSNSQQGRRVFKITDEGVKRAEGMLR